MKHRGNWTCHSWQDIGAIRGPPWRSIWTADNPVEVLNKHLSQLVECFVPTKVMQMHNKDKPWVKLKQEAQLRWSRDLLGLRTTISGGPPLSGLCSAPAVGLVCESVRKADLLPATF